MRNLTRMAMMRRGRSGGMENRGGSGRMQNAYNGGQRSGNPGYNYDGGSMEMRGNYGPENRRDSRGRYAPRNEMENAYVEGGSPQNYGPQNNGGSMRMGHDKGWVVQPIHQETENRYRMGDDGGRMIGFDDGQMRMQHGKEKHMERMQMGGSEEHGQEQTLDQKTAVEWVNKMENSDGSRGEHFTMEQTERIRKGKGWDCDPIEFWVAMNAMWSDGAATAKKYGVDKMEYWADRAKEFIKDKDAGPGKMAKYYKHIVKHE